MHSQARLPEPSKIACLTLDVEADYHDLVPGRHYQALEHEPTWTWLLQLSRASCLPWTAFVVGELLDSRPGLAERLLATGWELGLHAYSHDPQRADATDEIRRGKAAFQAALGREPVGYRAPLGKITPAGLGRLRAEGFRYDASLFPTWRPGEFNHLRAPTHPYWAFEPPDGLVEVPFAVLPRLRLVVSVSYVKLLGIRLYQLLLGRLGLPEVAIIDCHLHDLAPAPEAYRQLPALWKQVYRRNQHRGQAVLTWLVDWLKAAGYQFWAVGELVAQMQRAANRG